MNPTAIVLLVAAGVYALWSTERSLIGAINPDRFKTATAGANLWGLLAIICLIAAGVNA